jgi:hypothetical protein
MTKAPARTVVFLAAGFLALTGCHKTDSSAMKFEGVDVDISKLEQAFATAPVEILKDAQAVQLGFRYTTPTDSLAALEKLAANPAVTDPQKKVVNELIAQTRQVIARSQPPAGK